MRPLDPSHSVKQSKCEEAIRHHMSLPLTRKSVNLRFWMGIHVEARSEEKRAMSMPAFDLRAVTTWSALSDDDIADNKSEKCQAALGRTLLEEFHDGSPSKTLSLVVV